MLFSCCVCVRKDVSTCVYITTSLAVGLVSVVYECTLCKTHFLQHFPLEQMQTRYAQLTRLSQGGRTASCFVRCVYPPCVYKAVLHCLRRGGGNKERKCTHICGLCATLETTRICFQTHMFWANEQMFRFLGDYPVCFQTHMGCVYCAVLRNYS